MSGRRSHSSAGPSPRLATGIFRTHTGYRVFVRVKLHGQRTLKTKSFPVTATLTEMKQWREAQRVKAREPQPKAIRGSLADAIDQYLRQVRAMPTYQWRKRDLASWREVYGDRPLASLTPADLREQLNDWRARGPVLVFNPRTKTMRRLDQPLSASACNHRRTALLHLFTVLGGKGSPNPVREVPAFREPPPQPRARDLAFLQAVIARLQNPKQQAIAAVLLWTGIRGNSELAKMGPANVDLANALCHIPTGKGGHRFRTIPLTPEGITAWQTYADLNLWGPYDKNLLAKAFRRAVTAEQTARNLPPTPVRLYDQRHSLATAYLQAGADLADVQELLGHSSPRMTRRYARYQVEKLAKVAERL